MLRFFSLLSHMCIYIFAVMSVYISDRSISKHYPNSASAAWVKKFNFKSVSHSRHRFLWVLWKCSALVLAWLEMQQFTAQWWKTLSIRAGIQLKFPHSCGLQLLGNYEYLPIWEKLHVSQQYSPYVWSLTCFNWWFPIVKILRGNNTD